MNEEKISKTKLDETITSFSDTLEKIHHSNNEQSFDFESIRNLLITITKSLRKEKQ